MVIATPCRSGFCAAAAIKHSYDLSNALGRDPSEHHLLAAFATHGQLIRQFRER
jgi:hypothetical protein